MTLRDIYNKLWHENLRDYGYFYILPILLIVCSVLILHNLSRPKRKLPPGPTALPLVGYLPFLGKEPYRVLDGLRKKYGNVFSLYLGQTYVVILGDFTAVKDAFSKAATIDRPPRLFDFLPDGGGLSGFNGTEWAEQKRFILRLIKDIGFSGSTWSRLVEDEVSDFLKVIEEAKGDAIDIEHFLTPSICRNIGSFIFGKRLPPGPDLDAMHSALDSVMSFFSQAGLRNYYPWLCDVFVKLKITNYYKSACEMSAYNKSVRKQVDSHRRSGSKGNDFITTYVQQIQRNEAEGLKTTFHEKNLIGNTQALYLAGSDTTRASLTWLFLAMAAYSDVQEKVHRELDTVLGKEQRAGWEDRAKFPYIYATVMEGQRWRTVVPLNSSRAAVVDTKICGYDIPKGSTIIANNWGLHNDTRYWPEPEKFIPDRFLQNDGKEVILQPESYLPFSYGKRRCPGDIFATMEIFLYFTAIMQKFEVKAPNGGKPNLEGVLGLTYKPVFQKLCFVPRQEV